MDMSDENIETRREVNVAWSARFRRKNSLAIWTSEPLSEARNFHRLKIIFHDPDGMAWFSLF